MTKKQDFLHLFIKSLNKNEKRFFHLYTRLFSKNKTSNYSILFDILDKMPEYNHQLVLQKVQDFIDINHLNQLKHYLRKQLIEALRLYHKTSNDTIGNLENLGIVQSLIKRGFIEEAEKILQSTKKQALEAQDYTIVIMINNELLVLERIKGDGQRKNHKKMAQYFQEQLEILLKEKARIKLLLEDVNKNSLDLEA